MNASTYSIFIFRKPAIHKMDHRNTCFDPRLRRPFVQHTFVSFPHICNHWSRLIQNDKTTVVYLNNKHRLIGSFAFSRFWWWESLPYCCVSSFTTSWVNKRYQSYNGARLVNKSGQFLLLWWCNCGVNIALDVIVHELCWHWNYLERIKLLPNILLESYKCNKTKYISERKIVYVTLDQYDWFNVFNNFVISFHKITFPKGIFHISYSCTLYGLPGLMTIGLLVESTIHLLILSKLILSYQLERQENFSILKWEQGRKYKNGLKK